MAEIRWSYEAEQWLREIYEYIAQDNPTTAGKVISGIYDKAQLLSDFPKIGYKYRGEPEGEVRILLYGHYRIAYIVSDKLINILGVFHGALKIENYLP